MTPEALEALSWVARGTLQAGRFSDAGACAAEVRRSVLSRLRAKPLDSLTHVPTALGASIEVFAQSLASRGERARAVRFLKRELDRFGATTIRFRIRKNINLLTLEGRPAPELRTRPWIGPKPEPLSHLRGGPVLLFFWAHYCEDSRAQARALARLRADFGGHGLTLLGPSRLYGYLDEQRQHPAAPAKERVHIRRVLSLHYRNLRGMPVPLSERNFEVYGVSTTPTLTLLDPSGTVVLYHPGKMLYRDLAARIRATLSA